MEKQKSPEVRFKGFSDGWKQQTLGDMFIPLSNNTLSRADLNYDNGQIKNIHYGDILVKYAAVLDYKNDKIPFITDGKISDFKSQLLQNGDVIFADTAEDEVVGKAIEINVPADTFIVSGLHTMAYRPKAKLSSFYLGHYLNSNAYHHQLLPLMQGVKVLSISRTNLAKTIVRYPLSEQEQTQIGNFFQNLDQSIALHEKKLIQTQNLKKTMLEKMFPKAGSMQPEIRLKGFSGDWKGLIISDLIEGGIIDKPMDGNHGELHPTSADYIKSGIAFVMANDISNGQLNLKKCKNISYKLSKTLQKGFAVENDVLLTHKATIGETAIVPKLNTPYLVLTPQVTYYRVLNSLKLSNFFLQYSFQASYFKKAMSLAVTGATRLYIGITEQQQLPFLITSSKEQEAIGQFFKQLDETLVLQHQQLQTLKNLKQAFLEKMFV